MASCAIPGWYQPVTIDERRYIDGGAWSSTNIDLMAGLGLDEVYVLAPQVSFDVDAPRELATRLERQWRTRVTAKALREVAVVHADGTDVTVLGPGREDLEAMAATSWTSAGGLACSRRRCGPRCSRCATPVRRRCPRTSTR